MEQKEALRYIKTAKGQLEAVISMLEEERYCIDVSNQVLATIALLKKANINILQNHVEGCVKDAIENRGDVDQKLQEIEEIMKKLSK